MSLQRRSLLIATQGGGGVPDFATASWTDIQDYINSRGTDAFTDQIGVTRSITLSDSSVHTLRLVNATGNLYELTNGSGYTGLIIEFADCVTTSKFSSATSNQGPLAVTDPMGTTTLPAIQAMLPSDLKNILASVKVISAKTGLDGTLVSSDMKLFLPASKEIFDNGAFSLDAEKEALTTWEYYVTRQLSADRIKKYNGTAVKWWTRSPYGGDATKTVGILASGDGGGRGCSQPDYVSPCFCLAPLSDIYLYNAGDECTTLTGGWTGYKRNGANANVDTEHVIKGADSITIPNSGNDYYYFASTNNAVDLTPYSKLVVIFKRVSGSQTYSNAQLCASPTYNLINGGARYFSPIMYQGASYVGQTLTFEYDISSYSVSAFIGILSYFAENEIFSVYLEL